MTDGIIVGSIAGSITASGQLTATANRVAEGFSYMGADTNDAAGIGTLRKVTIADFGKSDATAWSTSPIVGATFNNYVGGLDFNLNGYYDYRESGSIRIHIPNLVSSNIRAGAQIGGPNGHIDGIFTGDSTATAADILETKTAGLRGAMTPGTMPNRGSGVHAVGSGLTTVSSQAAVHFDNPHGYYYEAGRATPWVYRTHAEVAATIGLTAAKMIKGQSCLSIAGTTGWAYGVREDLFNSYDVSVVTKSLAELGSTISTGATLLWEGSVHPEWPYVVFYYSYDQVMVLGKGGGSRDGYYVMTRHGSTVVYKFFITRDASGYTRFYVAATSMAISADMYVYLDCIGGTTEDFNG